MNRWIKITLAAAGLGVAGWTAGWVGFASTIPAAVADTATKTDAIVVLTGGRGRVEAGVELLRQGLAPKLFVSGAGGRAGLDDMLPDSVAVTPEIAAAVTLGREADDTPGNALETAAWAKRENITSLRLVTAAYHMRRSLLELQTAMPDTRIIPHPVFPANVKADWWRWSSTAGLIAREYSKFLVTWLRIRVIGATGGSGGPP
jgi:uncharacterized SAM-binding protein YcdF (DUF218 family)